MKRRLTKRPCGYYDDGTSHNWKPTVVPDIERCEDCGATRKVEKAEKQPTKSLFSQ